MVKTIFRPSCRSWSSVKSVVHTGLYESYHLRKHKAQTCELFFEMSLLSHPALWILAYFSHYLICRIYSVSSLLAGDEWDYIMSEVQGSLEFSVELHKFHNVDLFQRG